MNLRRKKPADSLYMLLDTMCNAFGGIILLAVLVVLLTNKEKSQGATATGSQALLNRQLALAQTNLAESLRLELSLQARASDPRWKQQMTLLTARQELQDQIRQTRETVTENTKDVESAAPADPAARLSFLNTELADAQAKKRAAQASLKAQEEEINRRKQRLAGLQQEVMAKLQDLQRPLRMPLEHTSDKQVVYVIAENGRLYPCTNPDLSDNNTDIHWKSLGFLAKEADPIPGKGLAPNASGEYFRRLSGNSVYVAFIVYEDSFEAFIIGKQMAVASGLTYGWEPRTPADGPVAFGPGGHTPGAQ